MPTKKTTPSKPTAKVEPPQAAKLKTAAPRRDRAAPLQKEAARQTTPAKAPAKGRVEHPPKVTAKKAAEPKQEPQPVAVLKQKAAPGKADGKPDAKAKSGAVKAAPKADAAKQADKPAKQPVAKVAPKTEAKAPAKGGKQVEAKPKKAETLSPKTPPAAPKAKVAPKLVKPESKPEPVKTSTKAKDAPKEAEKPQEKPAKKAEAPKPAPKAEAPKSATKAEAPKAAPAKPEAKAPAKSAVKTPVKETPAPIAPPKPIPTRSLVATKLVATVKPAPVAAPKPLTPPKPVVPPETVGEPQNVPAFKGKTPTGAVPATQLVLIGAVTGAFGVKGEVRLRAFTAQREGIVSYGPLYTADGKVLLRPKTWRELRDGVAVTAAEVKTREEAEKLKNTRLYVPRANLPATAEDEFYIVDLLGCRAEAVDGALLGEVIGVYNYGAGDVISIKPPNGGPNLMVTFTKETVPLVDLAGQRVVIDPPVEETA